MNILPYKTKLNHANAYWMARIAKAVYIEQDNNNNPHPQKILRNLKQEDPGFKKITPFAKNNAQAIIVEHKKYITMAFRGTDEIGDWADNVNIAKQKFRKTKCEFHKGFLKQFKSLWKQMEQKYNQINEIDKRPLFFTGHSLGGAIATLATAEWTLNGDRQFTSTYTFGQPRAITLDTHAILSPLFGDRFFRFHNNNDIVARIPFRRFGYSHTGRFIYIDSGNRIHANELGFWHRFQDRIVGSIESITAGRLDYLADHCIDEYLEAVENWDIQQD